MRIAVVTSQFPVAGDATRGRPVLQTVQALAKRADVEAFVPNARYPRWLAPRSYRYVEPHGGAERQHAVAAQHVAYPTLPLVGRALNGFFVGRSLRAAVRAFDPDLVLAYWLYPDAFGAAAVAAELGVPLVAGARGSDIRARDRLTLALTRRALARATRVLTVSDDLLRIAADRFAVPVERITTIPNGCDTEIFRPADRGAARAGLALARDARLVLFVGRIVRLKGVRELLAAWLELAREDPKLHLAMVGEGPLKAELRDAAAVAGLAERAHFPGALPAAAVARWIQACDVVSLPSHTEGHPNALVEALACGRPVVATPVGGILEIVDEGNGVLTPVGDSARLADALRSTLSRQWDAAALSRRFGRSWDDVAEETLAVCENALRSWPLSGRASTLDRSTSRTTS